MAELFANCGDPDQMPHSAVSDLGLHCLPITHLGVSCLQWVKTRCVYSLELPCQGTSYEYPQHVFCGEIRKIFT